MSNLQEARRLIRCWNLLQEPIPCRVGFRAKKKCWICTLRLKRINSYALECPAYHTLPKHAQSWLLKKARELLKDTDYEVIWDE